MTENAAATRPTVPCRDERGSLLVEHLLSSESTRPPLRIALLLDGWSLPGPSALAIEYVLRSDFARVIVVVMRDRSPAAGDAFERLRPLRGMLARSLLYELYDRWDRHRARDVRDILAPVDLGAALAGVPVFLAGEARATSARGLSDVDLAELANHQVDVALSFTSGEWGDGAHRATRFGAWSLRQDGGGMYRGSPPLFWEVADGDPVSAVSLEATVPDGRRLALCQGFASTELEDAALSHARNRVRPELLGATFVVRKLKELHERGVASPVANGVELGAPRPARRRAPSSVEVMRFLVPRAAEKARSRLFEPPKVVQWRIAVRAGGAPRIEAGRPFSLDGFRWVEAPPGRFYADPCLVEARGERYCFFEELDRVGHVGRISCALVDGGGEFRDIRPALELPYHLSYPFVFQDGGDFFMVPESRRNGTVDLFRAVEFPARWEKVRTLLHGPGLDTTVLEHGGTYWFFVAVRDPPGAGEQLLLFQADSLSGELRFHPANPISSDVRNCRPGGAIFAQDGRLVRPSQDCSVTYGYQLSFHEIVELTSGSYSERHLATVPPPRGMDGIHTYSRCGNLEVIDAKRMEPASWHRPR